MRSTGVVASAAVLLALALVIAWAPTSTDAFSREDFATSSDFYQMVEDVVAGRDYYAFLEVTPEQANEPSELKKAFRTLTRRWHPDKNPSAEAADRFRQVVFAYDILSNPAKKDHYDTLRTKGIPWHEKYYGRYAHRYGAPEHDVRWVLFWLITTVTVLHYAYKRHRYYLILSKVKLTPTYRHRQAQLRANLAANSAASSSSSSKKRKKSKQEAAAAAAAAVPEEEEPEVKLMGIRPPGWRDLVVVRLVMLPYTLGHLLFRLGRWLVWYKLLGHAAPEVDKRDIMRDRLGLTQEEFDEWEQEMKEKQEKAAKYTRRY
jgi:hypothetical protein